MAKLLLGKEVVSALSEKLQLRVAALRKKGIVPTLAIIRVGENAGDLSYEKGAVTRAEALGIAVVKYDGRKIVPEYLQAFMSSDESQTYIREHTRGATLQQINLSDLRIQSILVPPFVEQQTFADFVSRIDKLRVAVQASLDKTQQLFDSLMQEYFG